MAKKTKKKAKKKEPVIVDPYNNDTSRAEKIKVVDASQPTPAELKLEIAALFERANKIDEKAFVLMARLDRVVDAISKSKSVKGM